MSRPPILLIVPHLTLVATIVVVSPVGGQDRVEVSEDALIVVRSSEERSAIARGGSAPLGIPFGAVPDWDNTGLRRQVGALQIADVDGDLANDLVVGVYHSDSFPPYDDWHNLIYFNTGTELEATPSWVSTDEVSTGDLQVADIDDDSHLDVFAANGGFPMDSSVVYWGSAIGPSQSPGWAETSTTWTNYALAVDVDHDGFLEVITANQGNGPTDPHRPMYLFENTAGTLATSPSWQSTETSIQNFLSAGDLDNDGWEDIAVSKWANFESGVYPNVSGALATTPIWTTGDTDTDKGIGWADLDADGFWELALGHDPTQQFDNDTGTLSLVWSASGSFFGPQDLRWFDVDMDGDLDLAEIHFSNGVTNIYQNVGGVLETTPFWSYDSSTVGNAIAFGDLDGNGSPDLAIGYSGDPSIVVFYNQGGSLIFADGFESGDTSAWSLTQVGEGSR